MTYPEPPIILDLDPSGYVQGLGQAERQTEAFSASLRTVGINLGPMQRVMDAITPKRATLAGLNTFTGVAAKQQQQLSQLAGSAKVTGANFERMSGGIRQMARELPVGNRGATEMVTALARMGVTAGGSRKELNAVSKQVDDLNKRYGENVIGLKKVTGAMDSAFGNRGESFSTGAEERINNLGKTFLRLGAATGEGATGLASGMIQLNRSMGTGLSGGRVEALSDTLTTLSLQGGASATGILQFSKAISPMAQSAGIGQTKVMGIASAFAKLGDDGFAGANAFSKMMNDLNRSVREGTPQMAAYAQMAGKTTDEFRALYEANPAEALTQVVEAIGNSGNAPRLLEQIGLEGTRTARVLTNLAQAGDLRGEIEKATGSYGNGATQEASDVVFGGAIDSLTRLGTASEQVAEAFGRPMLGAVTRLTDAMAGALNPVAAIANAGPVQDVLKGLVTVGLPLLAGMKLIGPALTAAGIFQMASSGPVRGFLGGYAAGGGPLAGLAGRLGGNAFNDRQARGLPVGVGRMERVNQNMAGRGTAVARFLSTSVGGQGPGLLAQARGLGVAGLGVYQRLLSEQLRLARLPFYERTSTMSPRGAAYQEFNTRRAGLQEDLRAGTIDRQQYNSQLRKAFQQLTVDAGRTGAALRTLSTGMLAIGGQMAATGARLGGRALLGATSLFGGPAGALLMGGIGAGMLASGEKSYQRGVADDQSQATSWIDDYRMAMGKATEATSTFAGRMAEAAKAVNATPQSMDEARGVDQAEVDRALAAGGKPVRDYAGRSVEEAANAIALQAGTYGIKPDELNRVQQDLALSGFNLSQISEIMGRLPEDLSQATSDRQTEQVSQVATDLAGRELRGGLKGWLSSFDFAPSGSEASSPFQSNSLTKTTEQGAQDLATSIRDRRSARAGTQGSEFAAAEMLREMDAAIAASVEAGNTDLQRSLTTRFQTILGIPAENQFQISRNDLERSGGFSAVVGRERPGATRGVMEDAAAGGYQSVAPPAPPQTVTLVDGAGKPLTPATAPRAAGAPTLGLGQPQGVDLFGNPTSGMTPGFTPVGQPLAATGTATTQPGKGGVPFAAGTPQGPPAPVPAPEQPRVWQADQIRDQAPGNPLADWLGRPESFIGPLATDSIQSAIDELVGPEGTPESSRLQVSTMQEVMQHAREMGMSMGDLAVSSTEAANAIGNVADASYQLMQAIHQEAVAVQEVELAGRTPGEQAQARGERFAAQATLDPNDPASKAQYEEGVAGLRDLNKQAVAMLQERLGRYREFQVQMGRQEADYQMQGVWATQDYERQRARIEEDYGIQRARAHRDRNRQVARAERDFAKQMRRMSEDAARAMYDPYQRMAVQPTWDAANLFGNIAEQNEAIGRQINNLERLRQQGGSSDLIKMLGLNDPKNAQQLANLVDDVANDPKVLDSLNRAASARQQLGGKLAKDEDNTQFDRANEDFRTSMQDAAKDFDTAMSDMATSHATSLRRATVDRQTAVDRMAVQYQTGINRAREDLKRADEVITGDMETLTAAANKAVKGQFVDFQTITKDGMGTWKSTLQDLAGDWKSIVLGMGTDLQITVSQGGTSQTSGGTDGGNLSTDYHDVSGGAAMTSGFGPRRAPKAGASTFHQGVDYGMEIGTPIRAPFDGTVVSAGRSGGYGNLLVLSHGGGRTTRYGHLSGFHVKPGDRVEAGQQVALSGNTGNSTGPHLHFETRVNGQALNPLTTIAAWKQAAAEQARQHPEAPKGSTPPGGDTPDKGGRGAPKDPGGGNGRSGAQADFAPSQAYRSANPVNFGSNREIARQMMRTLGVKGTFDNLVYLWGKESGFNQYADNPSSSAYGIPQALPGTKMSAAGADWRVNPRTQIKWGLGYIKERYGSTDKAADHSRRLNWYGEGGVFAKGPQVIGVGERGPEAVVPLNQRGAQLLAQAMKDFLSQDEARGMRAAQGVTYVTYDSSSHHTDNRVVIEHVELKADSPRELAEAAAAKARRDRLTAPPQRRG